MAAFIRSRIGPHSSLHVVSSVSLEVNDSNLPELTLRATRSRKGYQGERPSRSDARKTGLAAPCGPGNRYLVKIGFMGGGFDPVHFGHLVAAQDAYEQHNLDRVVFVPASQAPLKAFETITAPADRLAMLRAATAWDRRFEVSDYELTQGGLSYTINSVRHFRNRYPNDQLYWIIGGDHLPKLHLWKDIAELAQMIEFIFLERPGHPARAGPTIPGLRLHRCDGHLIEISSTELRTRVKNRLSLDYFVPHKAIVYIQDKHLYL